MEITKISDLITKLQEFEQTYGDIDIRIWGANQYGEGCSFLIETEVYGNEIVLLKYNENEGENE
jgi:hypothetical protein